MSRRGQTYTEEQQQIALIFYERVKHEPDGLEKAARLANVEVDALRVWAAGGTSLGVTIVETAPPPAAEPAPEIAPEPEAPDESDDDDEEDRLPSHCPEAPEGICEFTRWPHVFTPAYELAEWAKAQFIHDGGAVANSDHRHLKVATIAWEWTNVANARQGRQIAATTALVGGGGGDVWSQAREIYRLKRAWGKQPHFLITVDAVWWADASLIERCVVVDHELYHCGMKLDQFRVPQFKKDGTPDYTVRGHDFEGFVGGYRRWGMGEGGVKELLDAFRLVETRGPLIAEAQISALCGTCTRR